jgi:hypothetical protein
MPDKHSKKFWIIFWTISALILAGWYFYLSVKNNGLKSLDKVINILPIDADTKEDYKSIAYFADEFLKQDGKEKTFLILFQNDMEIRPGGGYIGAFGILKFKDGKVQSLETYDLSNFDKQIPPTIEPPYPMKEILKINSWKLRDSNFSPDFRQNAEKAEYFYHLGQGQEQFEAVFAINSRVLESLLAITGPVEIEGYPGAYDNENAILTLEYQVEKGYAEQGIEKSERKDIMKELANAIIKKIFALNSRKKIDLAKTIIGDLNKKNIQLYFKDAKLEKQAQKAGWSGSVNENWKGDYLMMVDANMGSFKSDYYVKRSFDYTLDLSGEIPTANLKITYTHTAKIKDWMTRDYLTYLRVYVPQNSRLVNSEGLAEIKYGSELGKEYFGSFVSIPVGQTKTVELKYNLPQNMSLEDYRLLIQKQSGIDNLPGHIALIGADGLRNDYTLDISSDYILQK